jgi:GNAT superfamily N-acetyltransferase
MNDPHIRKANHEDAARLVAVYRSAYRENRELGFPAKAVTATEADLHDWLDAGRVFVAEIEGQGVGAVRMDESSPERAKISRLGVHEDWKASGIGSALLDHVEAFARREGFEAIWLTTPGDHPRLPAFYRDRGYRKTGDHPLDYREYDEIVMEKSLEGH